MTKRRVTPFLGACVLLTGGISASVLLSAGSADAAPCPVGAPAPAGTTNAGTPCTITGTLTMTAGSLNMTVPTSLGWTETVNGLDQTLVDPTLAHQTYQVNDSTGTATGWHVTASATAFVNGAHTLGTAGATTTPTFSTNGSIGAMADTTAPTAACLGTSTCTLPTDVTTYPVNITFGAAASAAPIDIYDASALTGLGTITIGLPGTNPVGWWLNVPSNTFVANYSSTITLELISGP